MATADAGTPEEGSHPPASHFMVCACEKFFNHQRTSAIIGGKNAKKIIQEPDRGKCDP